MSNPRQEFIKQFEEWIAKVLEEYETDDNKDVYANVQDMSELLRALKANWHRLTD